MLLLVLLVAVVVLLVVVRHTLMPPMARQWFLDRYMMDNSICVGRTLNVLELEEWGDGVDYQSGHMTSTCGDGHGYGQY